MNYRRRWKTQFSFFFTCFYFLPTQFPHAFCTVFFSLAIWLSTHVFIWKQKKNVSLLVFPDVISRRWHEKLTEPTKRWLSQCSVCACILSGDVRLKNVLFFYNFICNFFLLYSSSRQKKTIQNVINNYNSSRAVADILYNPIQRELDV